MFLDKINFKLPTDLVALHPASPRDQSKIIIVDKDFEIKKFTEIISVLKPSDALIFNDTKVLKAELEGIVEKAKVLVNLNKLLQKKNQVIWNAFIKSNKKLKHNDKITFSKDFFAKIKSIKEENNHKTYLLSFDYSFRTLKKKIETHGKVPLPSYIKKKRKALRIDNFNYQTILAEKEGAVAAPTASLHFSKKLLKDLKKKNIKIIKITLHVSGGTFLPIKVSNINKHIMHYEYGHITKRASKKINTIKKNGGRTTVLRLLETAKNSKGYIKPYKGETNIFIKPGWLINSVNGIITNFHTPKSTLLVLIYAIIGEEKTKKLYKFAIKNKLRFFSYGDACLIWNKNEKI